MSTLSHMARLRILFDDLCFYCARRCLPKGKHAGRTIDHFVPKSRGGAQAIANKVLACAKCNRLKKDRMPTDEERAKLAEIWRSRCILINYTCPVVFRENTQQANLVVDENTL